MSHVSVRKNILKGNVPLNDRQTKEQPLATFSIERDVVEDKTKEGD